MIRARLHSLRTDTGLRLLFKNSSWLLGSELFIYAITLLQGLIVARYLGAAGYGILSLVVTYVTLVNQVLDFKIFEAATRYIAEFKTTGEHPRMFAMIKLCYLVDFLTGIAAFVIVLLTARFATHYIPHSTAALESLILLYALRLLFSTVDGTSSAILTVFDRFSWQSLYGGFMALLQLGLITLLLHAGYGIRGVLVTYILVAATGSLLYLFLVLRLFRSQNLLPLAGSKISLIAGRWKEIRGFMLTTNVHEFLNLFTKNMDVLLLGYFRNATEVGYFRLAKSFVSTVSVVSTPFYRAFFPQLATLWSRNKHIAFNSLVKRFTALVSLFAVPAAIIIALLSPLIIRLTVGGQFLPSVYAIRVMIWGMLLSTVCCWLRPALLAMGKPGILMISNAFTAVTLMLLSLLFVPSAGYRASAYLFLYTYLPGHVAGIIAYVKYIRNPASAGFNTEPGELSTP